MDTSSIRTLSVIPTVYVRDVYKTTGHLYQDTVYDPSYIRRYMYKTIGHLLY